MAPIVDKEIQEMNRRIHLYHQDAAVPSIGERTVILVDDGLATGIPTRAAIEAVKKLNPSKNYLFGETFPFLCCGLFLQEFSSSLR